MRGGSETPDVRGVPHVLVPHVLAFQPKPGNAVGLPIGYRYLIVAVAGVVPDNVTGDLTV